MQKLLYYPNFEIQDLNFLKFALLYIDEIKPIIPMGAMEALSDETNDILKYTDLIQPIHPEEDDTKLASVAAMRFCEDYDKYLNESSQKQYKKNEYINGKMDYTLFRDKFSGEFEDYCCRKNWAEPCYEGIRIDQNVAFFYMSILADIISKDRQIDMITDRYKYSDANLRMPYNRFKTLGYERLNKIQREIEFQIPVDMRNISLNSFIKLRADERFNVARSNFSKELNKVLDMQERDVFEIDLYDYVNCKNEIYGLIKESFVACAATVVTVNSFRESLVNPEESLAFFEKVGNGILGLDSLKNSIEGANNYIEQLKHKKQMRRYLATLNNFGLGRL